MGADYLGIALVMVASDFDVSTTMSPNRSPLRADETVTFWCQQCMALTASRHAPRAVHLVAAIRPGAPLFGSAHGEVRD
jgi:hypothetical protein